jgi:hypothetical protein
MGGPSPFEIEARNSYKRSKGNTLISDAIKRRRKEGDAKSKRLNEIYAELHDHVNINLPVADIFLFTDGGKKAAVFAIEFIANLLSPAQIEGEDNNFACTDIKAILLGPAKEDILALLEKCMKN